jgi:hypothetical protein
MPAWRPRLMTTRACLLCRQSKKEVFSWRSLAALLATGTTNDCMPCAQISRGLLSQRLTSTRGREPQWTRELLILSNSCRRY